MPTASATVTAVTGAAQSVTSLAVTGIRAVHVDVVNGVLSIDSINAQGVPQHLEINYSTITTFTWTISGSNATIVLS